VRIARSKPLKPTSVRLLLSQAQSVWVELHAVEVRQALDPAQGEEEEQQLDEVDSVDFDFLVVFVGSKRAICESVTLIIRQSNPN
jgi:hypothetical protein